MYVNKNVEIKSKWADLYGLSSWKTLSLYCGKYV